MANFGSGVSSDVQVSQNFSIDKVVPVETPITIASTGSTPASGLNGIFSNIGHGLENLFPSGSGGSSMVPGDPTAAPPVDAGANMGKFVLFAVVAIVIFYWVNK